MILFYSRDPRGPQLSPPFHGLDKASLFTVGQKHLGTLGHSDSQARLLPSSHLHQQDGTGLPRDLEDDPGWESGCRNQTHEAMTLRQLRAKPFKRTARLFLGPSATPLRRIPPGNSGQRHGSSRRSSQDLSEFVHKSVRYLGYCLKPLKEKSTVYIAE